MDGSRKLILWVVGLLCWIKCAFRNETFVAGICESRWYKDGWSQTFAINKKLGSFIGIRIHKLMWLFLFSVYHVPRTSLFSNCNNVPCRIARHKPGRQKCLSHTAPYRPIGLRALVFLLLNWSTDKHYCIRPVKIRSWLNGVFPGDILSAEMRRMAATKMGGSEAAVCLVCLFVCLSVTCPSSETYCAHVLSVRSHSQRKMKIKTVCFKAMVDYVHVEH